MQKILCMSEISNTPSLLDAIEKDKRERDSFFGFDPYEPGGQTEQKKEVRPEKKIQEKALKKTEKTEPQESVEFRHRVGLDVFRKFESILIYFKIKNKSTSISEILLEMTSLYFTAHPEIKEFTKKIEK